MRERKRNGRPPFSTDICTSLHSVKTTPTVATPEGSAGKVVVLESKVADDALSANVNIRDSYQFDDKTYKMPSAFNKYKTLNVEDGTSTKRSFSFQPRGPDQGIG